MNKYLLPVGFMLLICCAMQPAYSQVGMKPKIKNRENTLIKNDSSWKQVEVFRDSMAKIELENKETEPESDAPVDESDAEPVSISWEQGLKNIKSIVLVLTILVILLIAGFRLRRRQKGN